MAGGLSRPRTRLGGEFSYNVASDGTLTALGSTLVKDNPALKEQADRRPGA
jgi:hypothetical protein